MVIKDILVKQLLCLVWGSCFCISMLAQSGSPAPIQWDSTSVYLPLDTRQTKILQADFTLASKLLQVFVDQKGKTTPAIFGYYKLKDNRLVFRPAFPFSPELIYFAVSPNGDTLRFQPSPVHHPPTVLQAIYPSAEHLPVNLLKMYLVFSQKMPAENPYQYLSLEDINGRVLEQAFLELEPALWDSSGTRLTLWFDPGRLKRDLGPNQHLGTPLEKGQQYRLSISPDWKDANGQAIQAVPPKNFTVGPADRQRPQPQQWKLILPAVQSREAIQIDFGEALDYALCQHLFQILNEQGQRIAGSFQLLAEERAIRFTPLQTWAAGTYQIQIASQLEDLAGNNLQRLFDRDLYRDEQVNSSPQDFFYLPFRISQD